MRILLGVSGGIAAYKALEFARLAVKAGHSVRVVQTPASLRFVGRSSFSAITGSPVLVSEFEDDPSRGSWPGESVGEHLPISHLGVVERADVVVVAPATANLLARLASGSADDIVTTVVLAARCPVVVAPAMNDAMWDAPATRENVELLAARGLRVLEPATGMLASKGEHGKGRLVEPDRLLSEVEAATGGGTGGPLSPDGPLAGRRVLVTAGGTREPIDSVRYIGNRSSGRMGVEIAAEAARRGAEVTLIAANLQVEPPSGCSLIEAGSSSGMEVQLEREFPACDLLVMAAAVADFRPVSPKTSKIDKSEGLDSIELEPVPDLLSGLAGSRREGQIVVGFAAEHGPGLDRARGKLQRKRLDAIVVNDISEPGIGFDSHENAVTVITSERDVELPRCPKSELAALILDVVGDLAAGVPVSDSVR